MSLQVVFHYQFHSPLRCLLELVTLIALQKKESLIQFDHQLHSSSMQTMTYNKAEDNISSNEIYYHTRTANKPGLCPIDPLEALAQDQPTCRYD